MKNHLEFTFHNQTLLLLPEKAIYWKEKKTLLIADVHLGKAGHFQKRGVNVPSSVLNKDISVLDFLIDAYDAERIIVLGDLFHAKENNEWKVFGEWLLSKNISFELVKGNHDILAFDAYERYGIIIHEKFLEENPFLFSHQPLRSTLKKKYVIAGHIHPAIEMRGKGYQYVRVECFCFGKEQAIIPAFGEFTGNEIIKRCEGDSIFVIAGNKVRQLKK